MSHINFILATANRRPRFRRRKRTSQALDVRSIKKCRPQAMSLRQHMRKIAEGDTDFVQLRAAAQQWLKNKGTQW